MTENAAVTFDTPMSSVEVVEQLWAACDAWSEKEKRFEALADAASRPGSRLLEDNAATVADGESLAVTDYMKQRAWNAARTLRALHRLVFETTPGKLWVNATVMYPLLRAALEDAAAIRWMQSPDERTERLLRVFRTFVSDNKYFTLNHRLLGVATASLGAGAAEYSEKLTAHMDAQKAESAAYFRRLATAAGLEMSEAMTTPHTSTPVKVEYGEESIEFVTWKFLSDLSHFSYMMLRNLATSPVPGSDASLEHITLLQLAQTVNRVCDDAIAAFELSLRPADAE